MLITITEEQARVLTELWGEPIGTDIDVRWIEFHDGSDIAVNINGRSLRYDTTDIDPDRAEVTDAIYHIIGVLTKNVGGTVPEQPDSQQRIAAREKALEALKKQREQVVPDQPPPGTIANPQFDKNQLVGPYNQKFIRDPNAPPPQGFIVNARFDANQPAGPNNRRFVRDPNAPGNLQPGPPPGFIPNTKFDARKPVSETNRRFLRDPNAPTGGEPRRRGPPQGFVANPHFNKDRPRGQDNREFIRDPNAKPPQGFMKNAQFDPNRPVSQTNQRFVRDPTAPVQRRPGQLGPQQGLVTPAVRQTPQQQPPRPRR